VLGDLASGYLADVPSGQAAVLTQVNGPGLAALREYLASGEAVAFLGAGASAPLYPLWHELIRELLDAAADHLSHDQLNTCRRLVAESPEAVVEIVRRDLGEADYRGVLRQVLRGRTDPDSGRSWTPVQELVCRCAFKGVVTTNYDSGIVDARMRVRVSAGTGFTTWDDESGMDRWRQGDVFGDVELPVLYAHGLYSKPDTVVLAASDYGRAYSGKLPEVLGRLMDASHLVWLGFSFADQRISAIRREIDLHSGPRDQPGGQSRHVALMSWDPAAADNDPGTLARRAEIEYGARLILYPAPDGDHSALAMLLAELTDDRFPRVGEPSAGSGPRGGAPPRRTAGRPGVPVTWVSPPDPVAHFTGRTEELARLDRWAADPQAVLIGVTAWGGAGKTALVSHWVRETGGPARRPGVRGVFGWSFYADPSAEHWARRLLEWARQDLGIDVAGPNRLAAAVLRLLREVPLLLVLDGLEVVQEGPNAGKFGRLLDGELREVLAGVCLQPPAGLVVLTSRFPFADLEGFYGGSARILEVPAFTPAEGSALLAAAGGGWLPDRERRALVQEVDGHALAIAVLAGLLEARPPGSDLAALRADLATATKTDVRVGKVLQFYQDRMSEPDRYLLAAVSLFGRSVTAEALLAVTRHDVFGSRLAGWTPSMVQDAVRNRMAGLASWYPDGTISAHPLVRDAFRPLVMDAAETAVETALAGMPAGIVTSRPDGLLVVEAIELLLDAGQWQSADGIYRARCDGGMAWRRLPAVRFGERAAHAFAGTAERSDACAANLSPDRLGSYLGDLGLYAMYAGDLAQARDYLDTAISHSRAAGDKRSLVTVLRNLAVCLGYLGDIGRARKAAAESLSCAKTTDDQLDICESGACLAWLSGLDGDAATAEQEFAVADLVEIADSGGHHLLTVRGVWWADWLARTGRLGPARTLSIRNLDMCRKHGWNQNVARTDRMLGRIALLAGETAVSGKHLEAAVSVFRDGDFQTELAITLADQADQARAAGDLDEAGRHVAEAISITAPRGLVPAQSAALSAKARICASRAIISVNPDLIHQGRDAADAARRLAVSHNLYWNELDAVRAHAALDQAEGIDRGSAAEAQALRARLVPDGLDPDPVATVDRLIASQQAPGAG
jgi:tetratricopeptide (TPR) repeat protein